MNKNIPNNQKRKVRQGSFLNRTLRRQILIPFLILIIFTGGVVAFVSYEFSVKTTSDELTQNVESQMESMNDSFELFFSNMDSKLDRFTSYDLLTNYKPESKDQLLQYLQETGDANSTISTIYTGIEATGEMIDYPDGDLGDDYDPRERPWYQKAVEADGKTIWTEPYTDKTTGKTIVSTARAFYNEDKLVGVMSIDVFVDTILDMINNIEIGETGYAVVFDKAGKYIAHPDKDYIGSDESEKDYYQKIVNTGDKGIVHYQFEGEDKIMGFVKNPTTGWLLGGTVYENDIQNQAQSIIIPISIALGIALIIAIGISLVITRKLTTPIKKLQTTMKEVENGNLIAEIDNTRVDEIGQLSVSFQNMLTQMREMMKKIANISFHVSEASQTLVASAEENTASSNEVATTMEQIASGAANESELMEQNETATDRLSEMISQIEAQNRSVHEEAKAMTKISEEGATTVEELRKQSDQTSKMTDEVVNAIHTLDEKSTNVSEIVNKISDISNQTNLLALNAAIEAARAGESGRGFAVVADEVRKLAEQSESALGDISELITEMQDETKRTVTLINETSDVIQSQSQSVNDTGDAFASITATIKTNNEMISKVIGLMDDISQQEKVLSENTRNIASISQETAAGTEEVSASIEEQTASMEQLNNLAGELEDYSVQMHEQIDQFTIDNTEIEEK
ncbi:methyl-accepting chemotaxis protein [Virgibacillus sp. FSP13]